MKIDCKSLFLILTTCHAMVLNHSHQEWATLARSDNGPPKQLNGVLLDRNLMLNQPTQTLLMSAVATLAPLFGHVVRIVPYVATGVNTVTGTINSGISAGFAIPIEDEFINFEDESKTRKSISKAQKQSDWRKTPLQRKSRNHL